MAFYAVRLEAPASTTSSAPVEADLEVVPGVVTWLGVHYPPGCVGLAHARILRAESVIWPDNPAAWLAGDDTTIAWDEAYDMTDRPQILTLQAYNEDDTYAHTLSLYVEIREAATPAPTPDTQGLLDRLRDLVGV